ncbi:lysophospholipid acyltransferase family protein [Pseudoroseomonas sp. WGS1072]|uniref:lysophospholipid acyltransferase family protein n=1 Tax=Roseomonas sp. WGS1072 TaxID=3366816 RepID=UPI003BF2C487
MCLAWSLPAGVAHWLLPERHRRGFGRRLGQAGISGGFRLYLALLRGTGLLRVDTSALDPLRDEAGLIIACNHPSMMDAVLMLSRLPRAACITKASLWGNPLLGGGVRLAGYVRNDASGRMIREAAGQLREGRQLLVFPEGTRSEPRRPGAVEPTPPPGPFSRSFAVIARRAGAPVQIVVIESDNPYLRKGWSPWRRPPLPLRYRLRLGARFAPQEGSEALSARVEAHLRQALQPAGAGTGAGAGPQPQAGPPPAVSRRSAVRHPA